MYITTILQLVKDRLGFRNTVRDNYITKIIESIIDELEDEKGLTLSEDNLTQLMFIVDYSTWRYQNRDSAEGMPRHIQYRLHNLMTRGGS